MLAKITIYSNKKRELNKFLSSFYNTNLNIDANLKWEKESANPVELADLIGVYIDNSDEYLLNMWITIDKNIYVKITENNADNIIKYLFERFPY